MRFGIFGSAQATRGGPDVDSGAGFREFVERNVEAEALGFHSSFLVEHHFTGFGQVSATLNLLTWVGARTTTLRLGTAVITLPWHNPVLLAEQAATIDLLSGGRLDFGIGKGYRHNEFAGFCIPMEEADERFEEALAVIVKAWTSDVPWSHRGKHWQFENVVVEPPTAQKPHPPLWMGAGHPESIVKVAERGHIMHAVRLNGHTALSSDRPSSAITQSHCVRGDLRRKLLERESALQFRTNPRPRPPLTRSLARRRVRPPRPSTDVIPPRAPVRSARD